ncbi:MAG: KpsF/GutQ family sugar-phosphate isomerase [Kiloniellales bacterium]|nr:KpsF/GutQ family sugar-phosphate isomerase [Kiloniellales bacterium]
MASREPAAAKSDLVAARRVLKLEGDALDALAEALDESFTETIDLLHAVTGRIVVTGMGKSGHVAHKIAATLASTGSPAQFVHPGEASHGDLGMITAKDAVVALSYSGQTTELSDMVAYTRRYDIPLIAITGRRGSALCEAADVALILPRMAEACPMGLAPTTSTTMAMALGDAVAIALLERRGFSAEDFQVFHPGGALGRQLLRVADVMHGPEELPVCSPDCPMADAILTMTAKRFGCVGVVDESGALTGIITDGDLRRHMNDNLLSLRAGDVMTGDPKTIRPQALAVEALRMMNMSDRPFTSLFVVEGTQPLGIVHIHDCLRAGVA